MTFLFPGQEPKDTFSSGGSIGTSTSAEPSNQYREFIWTDSHGEVHTQFADRLMFTAAHVLFAMEGVKFDKVSLAVHNDDVRSIVEVEG